MAATPPRNKRRAARRVWRQLELSGVAGNIRLVTRALCGRAFRQRFALARQRAPAPLADLEQVRELVLGILRQFGLSLEGITVKLAWEPDTKQLEFFVLPSIESTAAGFAGAGLKPEEFSSLPGEFGFFEV